MNTKTQVKKGKETKFRSTVLKERFSEGSKEVPPFVATCQALSSSPIDLEFTCDGAQRNPQIQIEISEEKKREKTKYWLLFYFHDPDAPMGDWCHWIVYNLPFRSFVFPSFLSTTTSYPFGTLGNNSKNQKQYQGPCPPRGDAPHRYLLEIHLMVNKLTTKASEKVDQKRILRYISSDSVYQQNFRATFQRNK